MLEHDEPKPAVKKHIHEDTSDLLIQTGVRSVFWPLAARIKSGSDVLEAAVSRLAAVSTTLCN